MNHAAAVLDPVPLTLSLTPDNDVLIWGMTNAERVRRLAVSQGIDILARADGPRLHINLAFVFDPLWFRHVAANPGMVLTLDGEVVIAHLPADIDASDIATHADPIHILEYADRPVIYNRQLRKLDCPFVERLTTRSRASIERQSYFGAYKGVTDILTKYLWPELALVLTRIAAQLKMTPNMVTAIGAICCVLATIFFAQGLYWTGIGVGFIFMVLDTVDGKLARCTITSSKWGNVFDHGIDLIHPPFWWYAWGAGLAAHGLTLDTRSFAIIMVAIVAGYIVQRLIEGAFIKDFGMDIHVWRRFDSRFRLITARRNPNMVILLVALLVGRPDQGLVWLAIWTVLSLAVHAVRLAQAYAVRARGGGITSWLEQPA